MDTSELYIEMCKKATEIQTLKPQPNSHTDWDRDYVSLFYLPTKNQVEVLKWDNDTKAPIIGSYLDNSKGAIWLPRPDQLQEMIGDFETCQDKLLHAGYSDNEYSSYWGMPSSYWETFTSMKQLWLAFVMHEKYGKTWNGTDWIKEIDHVET